MVNGLVQAAHDLFNPHVIEKQRQKKCSFCNFCQQVGLPITNVDHEISELRVSKAGM
jgi:hypothetical protein